MVSIYTPLGLLGCNLFYIFLVYPSLILYRDVVLYSLCNFDEFGDPSFFFDDVLSYELRDKVIGDLFGGYINLLGIEFYLLSVFLKIY